LTSRHLQILRRFSTWQAYYFNGEYNRAMLRKIRRAGEPYIRHAVKNPGISAAEIAAHCAALRDPDGYPGKIDFFRRARL
jgi:hypothetical protein